MSTDPAPTAARQALADAQTDQTTAEQDRDALQARADVGEDVASELVVARERAVIAGNRAAALGPAAHAEQLAESYAAWQAEAERIDDEVRRHREKGSVIVAGIESKVDELADHARSVDDAIRARLALGPEPGTTDHVRERTPSRLEMPDWLGPRVRTLLDVRDRLPAL